MNQTDAVSLEAAGVHLRAVFLGILQWELCEAGWFSSEQMLFLEDRLCWEQCTLLGVVFIQNKIVVPG